jgi:hypothetical protein
MTRGAFYKRGIRNRGHLSQLSLDFLVLNSDTSIVTAVELGDTTHALARLGAAANAPYTKSKRRWIFEET